MKLISEFFLKFSSVRFIRSFFYKNINHWFKYFIYFIVLTASIYLPYLGFQNKIYLLNSKNKILNKYINFVEEAGKSNNIEIIGNNYTKYEDILKIVDKIINQFSNFNKSSKLSLTLMIKDELSRLPWIKNIIISRSLPANLSIKIEEYQPFALWQERQLKYVINRSGKKIILINNFSKFPELLILSGKRANLNVKSLFNILATNLEVSNDIYSATWVGMRRWNIRFNNNILVKLPENNIQESWKKLVRLYNTKGSLVDLKVIDLRVRDKIYLEYENNKIFQD